MAGQAEKMHLSKASLLQLATSGVGFSSLQEALDVNVEDYEGSCADMYSVRSSITGFLNRFANYTPQGMSNDIGRLSSAQGLLKEFIKNIETGVPSLVQMGTKAQLQETLTLMDKFKAMSLVKQDTIENVRSKVADYLSAGNLHTQAEQAKTLLDSLDDIIKQVSSVKTNVVGVEAVQNLENKRQYLDTLIQNLCFDDYNPTLNVTQVDVADQSVVGGRLYRDYKNQTDLFEITGENTTEANLKEYAIGGWLRWLRTYDLPDQDAVIFRIASKKRDEYADDKDLEAYMDQNAILYANATSYRFCVNDLTTETVELCQTIDISGFARENAWHFVLLMYSFDTKQTVARVKVTEDQWISATFPGSITQSPFNGELNLYLGNDDLSDSVGFNGEMAGWNIWYGYNTWIAEEAMWSEDAADRIASKKFTEPEAVPYIEKLFHPNSVKKTQYSTDSSVFTYINSLLEAQDYGFAGWFKLHHKSSFDTIKKTLATFTFGFSGYIIGEVYLESGSIFVRVSYEKDGRYTESVKELAPAYVDAWFLVQVHYSTSNSNILAYFEQDKEVKTVTWNNAGIYIPVNVFLSFGKSRITNSIGADFDYKGVWIYAGEQTLYGQDCDETCKTCTGSSADDCASCYDGSYVQDGACVTCESGCKKCEACGDCDEYSKCTECEDGLFLNDQGKCGCDPTCLTCDGPNDDDCLTCADKAQVVVDGKCQNCDPSCAECSGPGPQECTVCHDGYKVDPVTGECVPVCDTTKCKECNEDGSQCTACDEPKVLYNGECVDCDESCLTCNGPENYQCIDCVPPNEFHDGKCFVCDKSCLTCSGPNDDECETCDADYELIDGKCLPPCDTDKGFYREDSNCLPCDESCETCTGPDQCTSCPDGFSLISGKCEPVTCDTANGYVLVDNECILCDINDGHVLINKDCIDCDPSCLTCTGPLNTDCLTCRNESLSVTNGECKNITPVCPGDQVQDSKGNCVDPCEKGFQLDANDNCVEICDEGFVNDVDGTCVCPVGTYNVDGVCTEIPCDTENGYVVVNGECIECDKDCLTCEEAVDHCTSCYDDYVLDASFKCNPPCDVDNGFVSINGECLPCHETCKTCHGTSSDSCDECVDGLEFVDGECVEPCDLDNGYVRIEGICLPCDESCKTCSDISNTDCITCFEPNTIQSGKCVPPNPNCTVDDGKVLVNNECLPCDESCKTCNGISNQDCLSCNPPLVLSGSACVTPINCTDGEVQIANECYPCDETCKTCSGITSSDCIECIDGYEKDGDECVPVCETYEYKLNGVCYPCDKDCETCDGPANNNCTSCPEDYFLEFGRCIPLNCVDEDYEVNEADNAECTEDCECEGTRRCSPLGICHDCNELASLFPNIFSTEHCPPCHDSCQTCSGSRDSDCFSCKDNEVLVDGYCKPCDKTCLTCKGVTADDCETCVDGKVYENGKCITPCDTDNGFFYSDPDTCSPCDKSCLTCSAGTSKDCTDCDKDFVLVDGECLVPCDVDNGFFYDDNKECQPCDDSCKTCSGPSKEECTECQDGYFKENGVCKPAKCVNYGYVFDESIITECNSDCECDGTRRCNPEGTCEDCHDLAERLPEIFTTDLCPPCDETCDTCRGPNPEDCTTCQPGFYLFNGTCLPCHETCNSCTGPENTDCVDCKDGLVSLDGLCVEPCDTEDGYFYDKDYECLPCHSTCKTCLDANRDSCESCYGDYILDGGICKPPCDTDKGYTYDDEWNCVPCDDSCLSCDGVGDDHCTECDDGFFLVNGHCENCVSFYYSYDESTTPEGPNQCTNDCQCDGSRRCSPEGICEDCESLANRRPDLYALSDCPVCDKTCLTCNGPTEFNCTTCEDGTYLGIDNACYPCDESCATCDGPSAQECTSCPEGFVLENGECVTPPPDCDKTCKTCDGETAQNCTSCYDDFELNENHECVPVNCIDWTYSFNEADSALGAGRCDDDCECDGTRRCSPSKYCMECLDLVSQYPDIYDLKDCPPCDDTCSSCFGPSDKECSSCEKGFFLDTDSSCKPCDDNCVECVGTSTNCTVCPEGKELNEFNECVYICDSSCETCSGPNPDNCTSCKEEHDILVDGVCTKPNCVALNYSHDETTNSLGPNRCDEDCDCDSTRRCSPDGFCRECMYLATLYPNLYNQTECPPCDDTCLTCQGPDFDDCTACEDGFVLIGGECKPCDKSCLTCNDVDDAHCLSCPDGFVLSDGKCIEIPPCDETCLECSGPGADNCTKCPDGKLLVGGRCVEPNCIDWDWTIEEKDGGRCDTDCDCNGARRCSPDKYCQECDDLANEFPSIYDLKDCPPCDDSCATCNGPNTDDCTSCEPGFVLVNGECKQCHDNCLTCSGVTDHDCLSCNSPLVLKDGECVDPPIPCDDSCLTCSGSAANECVTCPENFFLAWDHTCQPIDKCVKYDYSHDESTNELGPSKCYDDCDCDGTRRCSPEGYCKPCLELVEAYPAVYFESDCPVCDKTCLTCSGPSDKECTSCDDGFTLVDGECLPCSDPCLTCSGAVDECTSCTAPQVLQNGTCVDPPIECDSSCLECECEGPECCTKCPDNKVLEDGYCKDPDCISFDWKYDEVDGRCESDCDCDAARRCSPDKYCQECVDLVYAFPLIYSFDDCPVCDKTCRSCDGPTEFECTSCEPGFVLVDGQCLPCNETCATCSGTTEKDCVTCPEGYDLQDDGTCEKHIDCDPSCLTCNGPNVDQCVTCEDPKILNQGRCVDGCVSFDYVFIESTDGSCLDDCQCNGARRCSPSGFCDECPQLVIDFPAEFDSKDCPPCDDTCLYCSGPNPDDCIKCEDGLYLADDKTCQPCDKDCLTCDGPDSNNCLTCPDGYTISEGYCVPIPPICDDSCKKCSGPSDTECTECYDFFELIDGKCVPVDCVDFDYVWNEVLNEGGPGKCSSNCECQGSRVCSPDGNCESCYEVAEKYPSLFDLKDCPVCDDTCKDCDGPSSKDCIECEDNEALVDGECLPCDKSCLTCFGTESNNCITCPEGQVLNSDNECVDPPPVCDETCATCSGPNDDECTSCNSPLVLIQGRCVDPKDCIDWGWTYEENADGSCLNDCECAGSRMCGPYGFCHECEWLVENFPDDFSADLCPVCDDTCATCSGAGPNDCNSCPDGTYLETDKSCQPCDKDCLTCSAGSNKDCTSCESPLILLDGSCTQPPPICDETCAECKGPLPTDCTKCYDNYELTEEGTCEKVNCIDFNYKHTESANAGGPGVCVDDCDCDGARRCGPSGYCDSCLALVQAYPSTYSAKDCPDCDGSCADCDGPLSNDCIDCLEGFSLINGECIQCHENCTTCYGPLENNCLSCPEGKFLFEGKCEKPDPECDPSCVTCSGPDANQCTACKCDQRLTADGYCVDIEVTCDETCSTCYGSGSDQCTSCVEGRFLLKGSCVVASSLVGKRSAEETPISYKVPQKFTVKSDIGLGAWTKVHNFVETDANAAKDRLMFRLSGLTDSDKQEGTNKYRSSSLAVFYNTTHYTFETYTKSSGSPVLVQKSVHVGAANIMNKWNLVFFGYSRKNSKATGFVKMVDGSKYEVEFENVYQDLPKENMEVFFFGDNSFKGVSGDISSPEVIHGNNFLQGFSSSDVKSYFQLREI